MGRCSDLAWIWVSFLATASRRSSLPAWPSREPPDLRGLSPGSPPWPSSSLSPWAPCWGSFVGWSLIMLLFIVSKIFFFSWDSFGLFVLNIVCCSHSAHLMTEYSATSFHQFIRVLHYSISLFLIWFLLDYCSFFWSWKCIPWYFDHVNINHLQVNKHHSSQDLPTSVLV
jgi:hypothetical protein